MKDALTPVRVPVIEVLLGGFAIYANPTMFLLLPSPKEKVWDEGIHKTKS